MSHPNSLLPEEKLVWITVVIMRKKLFYLFAILVYLIPQVFAEGIRFEKVDQYLVADLDRKSLKDIVVKGDSAFVLLSYYSPHQFTAGRSFYRVDFDEVINTVKDYFSQHTTNPLVGRYWMLGLTYVADVIFLPEEETLLDKIYVINNIVHLPDRGNYSHQFTIKGDYLGRIANFSEYKKEFLQGILLSNKPIQTPIDIFGQTIIDMDIMGEYVILVSETKYIVVNINDLALLGEEAPRYEFIKWHDNPEGKMEYYPHPLGKQYFCYKDKLGVLNIHQKMENNQLQSLDISELPVPPFYSWFQIEDDYYYQLEFEYALVPILLMTKWQIHGLPGLSGVDHEMWKDVK